MEIEELRNLADSFFEWPTEDRTHVTLTSALLFAQHVLRMAQQAGNSTDQLRFKSACEISGDKHPEYVRGYEAAMDAACRARKQQAEPVAYGVKSNEESGFIFSLGFSKKLAENQCSLLGGHVVPLYTAPQAQTAPIPTSERLAAGRILTCVYCGHEYPQDTPAHGSKVLTDHISQCEKHPMRDVIDQRDKLKSALAGLIGASDSAELRNMELIIRLSPAPAADKAAMLDAIHVLLNVAEQPTGLTMPPAPTNKEQANAKDAD